MTIAALTKISGARLEIHPSPVKKTILEGALLDLGYTHLDPKPRSNSDALREAQKEYAKGIHGRTMVQPLKGKNVNGYEVVNVHQGEMANSYAQEFKATQIEGTILCSNPNINVGQLQKMMDYLIETLPVGSVRDIVDTIIINELNGYKAVPSVYWIPDEAIEMWDRIYGKLNGIQALFAHKSKTDLADQGEIEWVIFHIREHIASVKEELMEGLSKRQLQDNTIKQRRERLSKERERLMLYEPLLGDSVKDLRETLAVADEALVANSAVEDGKFFSELF